MKHMKRVGNIIEHVVRKGSNFIIWGKDEGKNQTNRGREKYLQQLLQSSLLKQSKYNLIEWASDVRKNPIYDSTYSEPIVAGIPNVCFPPVVFELKS